jgi:hypothetical protein
VEKTKSYRRSRKTKIMAALIVNIATAVKCDCHPTIMHIAVVLDGLLKTSFIQYFSKILGLTKSWQNWSPNFYGRK